METPIGAPFKVKLRIEIAKLKEMTLKGKLEYIWDYYKPFIIALIAILALTAILLNTWLINPAPKTVLFVSWSSGFATQEQIDDLTHVLEKRLIEESENENVIVSQAIINDDDPAASMMIHQRTVAMVAAGAIDVFILDSALIEVYNTGGFIRPLESLLAEIKSINPAVYDKIVENVTYSLYEAEDGSTSERITGIGVGKSPLFTKLGFFEQELYFSVVITSSNSANILQTLLAFFD